MDEYNKKGLMLHARYAFAAISSSEKHDADVFLAENVMKGDTSKESIMKLFEFAKKNCPYLLMYVSSDFDPKSIRTYWLGSGRDTHLCVKFRDWVVDDILGFAREGMKNKCTLDKLNECIVSPAKVVEAGRTPLVEYTKYAWDGSRLYVSTELKRLKLLFDDEVRAGDIIAKHFDYGIEKIDFEDGKKELADAFNARDAGQLEKLLPLDVVLIRKAFEKMQ